MAFVNENITSEEDKALINSFGFKNPFSSVIKLDLPRHWTIDRERDVFLVGLGGTGIGEMPKFFVLVWNKNVVMIETFKEGKGDQYSPEGVEIRWKITKIQIPEPIYSEKDKVIELIKESFEEMGCCYKKWDNPVKIYFDYIAYPQKIMGEK